MIMIAMPADRSCPLKTRLISCSCGQDGIVRVDPAIAAEVLVAANEIRQMENGIFAGTLTPSMFDAAEARPALQFVRKD